MDNYRHGAYAYLGDSILTPPVSNDIVPVYVGRLPVHLATSSGSAVNEPILLQSFADAASKVGYSQDWDSFELCEAIDAHFLNDIQPIGPIVVINVFDPSTMRSASAKTQQVTLVRGYGRFTDSLCIGNTVMIAEKEAGVDFEVMYDAASGQHILHDITGTLVSPVEIEYTQADPTVVTATDIIGGTDANGVHTGLYAIEYVFQAFNLVPSILCSPKWSATKAVYVAMIERAQEIDSHWAAVVFADIPAGSVNPSIASAIEWKHTNEYTSEFSVPCWPQVEKDGKVYHASTIAAVATMQTDFANGGIPFETPSNKEVDITGYYIDGANKPRFTQTQVNQLNAAGIRTVSNWGGRWVLWGAHTGAYGNGGVVDPRAIYDSNMRMLLYVVNQFQVRYIDEIDKPMRRSRVESILAETQDWLAGLTSDGSLLLGQVYYAESENSADDYMSGSFKFRIRTTTTPPLTSLTAAVSYTDEGLSQLYGTEAE